MSPWFFPLPFCSCFMNCHNSSLKSTSLIVLESNFPSILFLKSLSFLTYCPTHLFSLSPFPMSLFFLLLASFFSSENCQSHDIGTLQIYFSVFSVYLSMFSLRFSLCLSLPNQFSSKESKGSSLFCAIKSPDM